MTLYQGFKVFGDSIAGCAVTIKLCETKITFEADDRAKSCFPFANTDFEIAFQIDDLVSVGLVEDAIQITGFHTETQDSGQIKYKILEDLRIQSEEHNLKTVEELHSDLTRMMPKRTDALPMLIIANPKSGQQKALKICHDMLLPRLDEGAIPFELMVTERQNHAKDYIASCQDLHKKYKAIVIVSGDGLLHEVVQGLCQEGQPIEYQSLALGIVPGGSGNGLARSLAHYNNESYEDKGLMASVVRVLNGATRPMDLTRVTSSDGKTYYSFLSVGWGFFADTDIGSECLRFMGELRFYLYSIKLLAELKTYRGRLSYKTPNSKGKWITEEDEYVCVYAVTQPWVASDFFLAPDSKLADGLIYLTVIRKNITRSNMLKVQLGLGEAKHTTMKECVDYFPVTAFKLEPLEEGSYITVDGEVIDYGLVEAEVLPSSLNVMAR